MSNDFSWLPVIGMAVRHLVWVLVGAPGPVQGAATADTAAASNTIPNSTGLSFVELRFFMEMSSEALPFLFWDSVAQGLWVGPVYRKDRQSASMTPGSHKMSLKRALDSHTR